MEIIQTNKIIIESFEKIGFTLQYVYQGEDDCDEISLSIEIDNHELKEITISNIADMKAYIESETDYDMETLDEFENLIFNKFTEFVNLSKQVFLVWE